MQGLPAILQLHPKRLSMHAILELAKKENRDLEAPWGPWSWQPD